MKLWTKGAAVIDHILNLLAILSGVVIIFMMLSVSVDVVMRYALNRPIMGVLEINEYALLYATFLGTAWLLKRGGHVTVEMIVARLRPKAQAMAYVITSILGAIACGVLMWYSAQCTWDHLVRGVRNPGAVLQIPIAAVVAIIPIGSFLLFIQFLRRTSGYVQKWRTLANKFGEK